MSETTSEGQTEPTGAKCMLHQVVGCQMCVALYADFGGPMLQYLQAAIKRATEAQTTTPAPAANTVTPEDQTDSQK